MPPVDGAPDGAGSTLQSAVDLFTRDSIAGWAWDPSQPGRRVELELRDAETALTLQNGAATLMDDEAPFDGSAAMLLERMAGNLLSASPSAEDLDQLLGTVGRTLDRLLEGRAALAPSGPPPLPDALYGMEVLRLEPVERPNVVYIHRFSNARNYMGLVRRYAPPRARVLFCVADLHFLRMEREAALARDPELAEAAARQKREELALAAAADCCIVHSPAEAALLAELMPEARVAVVPWAVAPDPTPPPFARRRGSAFIGSFAHPPNRDAVEWLGTEVRPLLGDVEVSVLYGSAWHMRHNLAGLTAFMAHRSAPGGGSLWFSQGPA